MAEPRTIASPKENVAEKPVVLIQDAQTRIKQVIVESYYKGLSKTEIEKALQKIIWETGEQLPENMRESVKQALAQNAQKWHYLYTQSIKASNASVLQAIDRLRVTNPRIAFAAKTYNISLTDHLGSSATEQKAIIDKFRPYLTEDRHGSQVIDKYESKVKEHLKTLARDPAYFQRIDKNGKPYKPNLRNFAEMTARYEANLEDVKRLRDSEVKLVWTSSHVDASDRCALYQGKLYSLDGSSGSIDGTPYTPLDEALAGPRGDGNGIINGYNCRHRLIEYTAKSRPPKEYDRATIHRENAINNRQRQYERDIRNLKIEERLARQAGYKSEAAELEKQWQKLNKHYQAFSLRNERAYYPWRTRATQEEIDRQG
jgi:hypothetical protein